MALCMPGSEVKIRELPSAKIRHEHRLLSYGAYRPGVVDLRIHSTRSPDARTPLHRSMASSPSSFCRRYVGTRLRNRFRAECGSRVGRIRPRSVGPSASAVPKLPYSGRRAVAIRRRRPACAVRHARPDRPRRGSDGMQHVSRRFQPACIVWRSRAARCAELAPAATRDENGLHRPDAAAALRDDQEPADDRRQGSHRHACAHPRRQARRMGLESRRRSRVAARNASASSGRVQDMDGCRIAVPSSVVASLIV